MNHTLINIETVTPQEHIEMIESFNNNFPLGERDHQWEALVWDRFVIIRRAVEHGFFSDN